MSACETISVPETSSRNEILPREKLAQRGVAGLSDAELITVLLGSGVDGCTVTKVARSVTRRLTRAVHEGGVLTWRDLLGIRGIGRVKAMQVECALELGRRLFSETTQAPVIRGRSDVIAMFSYLKSRKQEHVVVVALDARNRVIGRRTVAIGGLNKTVVEPRDVLGWAVERRAANIILVHNHPSGDSTFSTQDNQFTKRIARGAELLGLRLVDHVVV
ncbi:MAG: DNA repair protein RadC [Candidatus Dojkabacteria bacterium]|nr:DNA repair protein RadC [Candidatus Dojkabacteria bacterium]